MKVHHRERLPLALLPFADHLEEVCPFETVVPPSGGIRNDAMQLLEWGKGRLLGANGVWRIVNPKLVVTYAQFAHDSAHGHGGACDLLPLRTIFPNGMPATVYLGNEDDPIVRAEALRRLHVLADIAKAFGLECGRDFPDPDLDHFQVPHWRDLPLVLG